MNITSKTILCVLLFVLCFGAREGRGGWLENGVPLTQQWGAAGDAVVTSDGSSGAIIAYKACRYGVSHVMAQRVDALGNLLWGPDGVIICALGGGPDYVGIVADGAGGAIVTWEDGRAGDFDIFAQRVDGGGNVQWAANGVAVCTATGLQTVPQIITDGAGGAIIAWYDTRAGNLDLYAQRVLASGLVQWAVNGVPVCQAQGALWGYLRMVSDGTGGGLVTWMDGRSGPEAKVYAQRLDASGAAQWAQDGLALCTAAGSQSAPGIISDGTGGAIVAWQDDRAGSGNTDVYAQRVDASGSLQWLADGIAVCDEPGTQERCTIVPDGAGGAIVAWDDYRSGDSRLYTQRLDSLGTVLWAEGGVPLCAAAGTQYHAKSVPDGSGGAMVAWLDRRGGDHDIYAQRVNAAGATQWSAAGVPVSAGDGDSEGLVMAADATAGAVLTWGDTRGGDHDIYAQRLDGSGAAQWTENGVFAAPAAGGQYHPEMVSDGAGGAIAVWDDDRNGRPDIYAQRVAGSGTVLWTAHGIPVCAAPANQESPQLVPDDAGGAIVTWRDYRNGAPDVYAQRVSALGNIQWTVDGEAVCTAPEEQSGAVLATDGAGGAIIAWRDYRSYGSNGMDIYAQRVDAVGSALWVTNGAAVCTATGNQAMPRIVSDGAGGAIIAWVDLRSGESDIYAQRIDGLGAVQWTANGVPLCAATGHQEYLEIVSDGAGGAIAVWQDERFGVGEADIYAQRVDAAGNVQWTADGVAICATGDPQTDPALAADGAGGAIIAWHDGSPLIDMNGIYAQRVDGSGTLLWGSRVHVSPVLGFYSDPQVVSDGADGAIVAWVNSYPADQGGVYAQRLGSSGNLQWVEEGVALCASVASTSDPQVVSDGASGAIVAWEDSRCATWIYAQRVRFSGHIVGTLLQRYSAVVDGESVLISWNLSEIDEDVRFLVFRASAPDWRYVELDGETISNGAMGFSFTDTGCRPGNTYKYRVDWQIEESPRSTLFETGVVTVPSLPMTLFQNYPNPFNPSTAIRFYLPAAGRARLAIYDVAGRLVRTLVDGLVPAGYHHATWDGRDDRGQGIASGAYFARLEMEGHERTVRVSLVR